MANGNGIGNGKGKKSVGEKGASQPPSYTKILTPFEKQKEGKKLKDIKPERKGSLEKMLLQESMGVEKQSDVPHLEPKKAKPVPISGSRPERTVEKLPEQPKPKHRVPVKDVITNIKLGINDFRQRQEESRYK